MDTIAILGKAARRECPECGGAGIWTCQGIEIEPDIFSGCVCGGEKCPNDCPHCEHMTEHKVFCDACNTTGLWLPELSKECPFVDTHGRGWNTCPVCQDTCRILDNRDRLDAAAERLRYPDSQREKVKDGYLYYYGHCSSCWTCDDCSCTEHNYFCGYSPQAALADVIKYVWPEVEDDE